MISIKQTALILGVTFGGLVNNAAAQQSESKYIFEVPTQATEQETMAFIKKLPVDGWVIVRSGEMQQLINLSNKEYMLGLRLSCANGGQPGYIVQYTDAYRDGDYGGIDFISSQQESGSEVHFLLDGKDHADPFAANKGPQLKTFAADLKQAHKLTISVYDSEMNPETGKDERRLNRSIDFKLAHGELLDVPVTCAD